MYQRKLKERKTEPATEDKKSKTVFLLVPAALILILIFFFLIFNFNFNKDEKSDQTITAPNVPVTKETLSKDIDSVLFTFGISKDWIRDVSKKDKTPGADALWFSKEVKIPADILNIDLNYELTNYFRSRGMSNRVSEEPKTKNLLFGIYTGNDTARKLTASVKFIYTDSLKRIAADVCLILDSLEYYPLNDVRYILSSAEAYSVFLPLRNDKADYQSAITEAGKDYLTEFTTGSEKDITADFREDMNETSWKAKVKSVPVNFPGVSGIILKSGNASQEFQNLVIDEFSKINLKVFRDTIFTKFKSSENIISSLFENIISNSKSGKKFLAYQVSLSPSDFKEFEKKVYQLKKFGYEFVNFKEMMKRQNVIK